LTAREALAGAAAELAEAGCPSPRVDAEWLLAHELGISRTELYADGARELGPAEEAAFSVLVRRREAREPLAYILGMWGFRRLTLRLDRRALIPRPETEVLVERCLALLSSSAAPRVLDIGVGSGAIALAIVDEHPGARVVATDNSADALALAAENCARLGLGDRVELVEGELFASCAGPFDLVVSNPPYVAPGELDRLEPELRYEPREALVGVGRHEAVGAAALRVLRPGGPLVLEAGDGQAPVVAEALRRLGFTGVRVTRDLAGRDRVVEGRRP
jgi:release factor glutamine methyltransferase